MKSKIASSLMYGHIVMMSCCALLNQDREQRRTKNIVLGDNGSILRVLCQLDSEHTEDIHAVTTRNIVSPKGICTGIRCLLNFDKP